MILLGMIVLKNARNPKNVHLPVAPYVHQIEISNPMRWLTISEQLGMGVDGNVPESPLEQMELAFQNIDNNLVAANMEIKDNTKLVFYLS